MKFSDNSKSIINTPIQYFNFDFILILTDNLLWQETFGLVGAEQLYADVFLYILIVILTRRYGAILIIYY